MKKRTKTRQLNQIAALNLPIGQDQIKQYKTS